jgi:uncharacterized tellurite resistance protein B-like protein
MLEAIATREVALKNLAIRHTDLNDRINELTNNGKQYVKQTNEKVKAIKEEKEETLDLYGKTGKAGELLANEQRKNLINVDEFQKANLLQYERNVSISDALVLEKEITLEKAKQSGKTKDIEKAEKELKEAKIKQINDRLELEIQQTEDLNKQDQLRKQAELDILKLNENTDKIR